MALIPCARRRVNRSGGCADRGVAKARGGRISALSASSLGTGRPLEGEDDAEAWGVVGEGEVGAVELGHGRDQA